MTTEGFSGAYDGFVHYIDSPVFIYSPAPVIVEMPDAPEGYPYTLTLTNQNTGQSYSEKRLIHNGVAHFEISRILQHLMSVEVTDVFNVSRDKLGAHDSFHMAVTEVEDRTTYEFYFHAIYGALDQLEGFSDIHTPEDATPRRLWVNYPQTVRLQRAGNDAFYLQLADGYKVYPSGVSEDYVYYEVDLMRTLGIPSNEAPDVWRGFHEGRTQTIGLSSYHYVSRVDGSRYVRDVPTYVRFIPDLSPVGCGTYLRWLHRDGSFGYWLFKNGDLAVSSNADAKFTRTILDNPAESSVEDAPYIFDRNPSRGDFSEARTLSLGTYVNNQEEFDYLCGLATSPVVDRYVVDDYGTAAWQRVNILPGSYFRSRRFDTPSRRAFEISIELPQRNTIKL